MKRVIIIFTLLFFPSLAFSFPFRGLEVGQEIPSVKLNKTDGGSFSISPSKVKGKGLILLFWDAGSEAKKNRAIELMEALNGVQGGDAGIEVVAINVGDDSPEVINEITSQVNPKYPVLLDKDRKAYKDFGLFVEPSVLLVNAQGLIHDGFAYSNVIKEKIETEVLLLLGKVTEEEANKEMVFEATEKPEQERKAIMHLELGMRMEDRRQPDKAKEEYARAVELFDLAEAHIRLGSLLLEEGDIAGAEPNIKKGLALDPDSLDAKIANARLRIAKGDTEGIVEELQALSLKSPQNYVLHCALGNAHETKGELKDAVKEYRKAFELLRKTTLEH